MYLKIIHSKSKCIFRKNIIYYISFVLLKESSASYTVKHFFLKGANNKNFTVSLKHAIDSILYCELLLLPQIHQLYLYWED